MTRKHVVPGLLAFCSILTAAAGAEVAAAAGGDGSFELAPGMQLRNVERPFEYFSNSWTVIGLKDYPNGTQISPKCELLLAGGLKARPLLGGAGVPLDNRVLKTLRDGYLPIVKYDLIVNGEGRCAVEALACPMDPTDAVAYDGPRAGDNYLNLVRITLSNVGTRTARGAFTLEFEKPKAKIELAAQALDGGGHAIRWGDDFLCTVVAEEGVKVVTSGARLQLIAEIAPGVSRRAVLCTPFTSLKNPQDDAVKRLAAIRFDDAAERTAAFWNALLEQGATIDVPEKKARDTYKASLVYQFIGRDRGELHAGEGFYDRFYLRDGAYQALSLLQAGYVEEARSGLETFAKYQRPDGRFESQKGQLDANGYAMWAPVEFYWFTHDLEWLRRAYPAIRKAGEWVQQARRTVKDPSSPFFGILPAAIADGEFLWDGKHHIVGYDLQNLRGLQAAAGAAKILQDRPKPQSQPATCAAEATFEGEYPFVSECYDYAVAIRKALERTGLPYFPPSYEGVGTPWGNLEVAFPTAIMSPFKPRPFDPRLTATLAWVRNEFTRAVGEPRGFVEGTIQWNNPKERLAIHPYLSQFVTNTHILRGEQRQALEGFYWYLLHTTSTHGFPEGIFYKDRFAWADTVPHLWAAALYVTTLRNMLVLEEGDPADQYESLHLLPCVPRAWLEGRGITVKGAPTHFGPVSFTARQGADGKSLDVVLAGLERPVFQLVVHPPYGFEVTTAMLDGQPVPLSKDRLPRLTPEMARMGGRLRIELEARSAAPPAPSYEGVRAEYSRGK